MKTSSSPDGRVFFVREIISIPSLLSFPLRYEKKKNEKRKIHVNPYGKCVRPVRLENIVAPDNGGESKGEGRGEEKPEKKRHEKKKIRNKSHGSRRLESKNSGRSCFLVVYCIIHCRAMASSPLIERWAKRPCSNPIIIVLYRLDSHRGVRASLILLAPRDRGDDDDDDER